MNQIRPATTQGVPEINALIEQSKRFWEYPETYLSRAIPLIQITADWLNDNKGWVIGDRSIQGFIGIEQESDGWLLDHLWIHPDYIGKGLGRQSVHFLTQTALRNGVKKIRLLPDPPVENFYLKMGACHSGKEVNSRVQDGLLFREMIFMLSPTIVLKQLTGANSELADLQHVLESAPNFAQRTTGAFPGRSDAQSTFSALPPNKTVEDKFVFNIYFGNEPVGCADLIRGYRDPHTAWIGLLLIDENRHSIGLGRACYQELETIIRSWNETKRIRLSVVATNEETVPFWKKVGFELTGERKPYSHGKIKSEVIIMEKALLGVPQ